MTTPSPKELLLGLLGNGEASELKVLAELAHNFGIAMRDPDRPLTVMRLRTALSLQTRFAAELVQILAGGEHYPHDVLADILIEEATAGDCLPELQSAIAFAAKRKARA
jgi:hypothetical protein